MKFIPVNELNKTPQEYNSLLNRNNNVFMINIPFYKNVKKVIFIECK